ncbi:MAG: GatB/YqeY domain-containing protein [Gammaproteobacteria bacterium]|nr:MAG: GatB/YqeY domain-containing protein [Gammaproteobacteria bacterium]
MASALLERIQEDVKAAMRARDRDRLGVLRQITAAIKQREVDERRQLDDSDVIATLERMRKQRRESIAQFEQAGREDLARKEREEIGIIESYLPEPLGEEEIADLVEQAIEETGAASVREMGKVMGLLKLRLQGRADMGQVSTLVRQRLSG